MSGIAHSIAQRRTKVLEELIDQLQIDCEDAKLASDVEQLVAEISELTEPMWRMIALFRDGVQPETEPIQIASAQMAAKVLHDALSLFPRVRNLIQEVRRRGLDVDGIERFENAEAEIALIRKDFVAKWPMPDETRVKSAKQQLTAGNFRVL